MLLCRRRQHCQDGDHSDREHSQGCQSHESSNTPGYLSGVRLTTKGIPVAEKKEFRTTSPIKTFFKKPIKNTRQHHQTTNHFTSYTYIYTHSHAHIQPYPQTAKLTDPPSPPITQPSVKSSYSKARRVSHNHLFLNNFNAKCRSEPKAPEEQAQSRITKATFTG